MKRSRAKKTRKLAAGRREPSGRHLATERQWLENYNRAAMLYDQHGHSWWQVIPQQDGSFVQWLQTQRYNQKIGKLRPDRKSMLEEIDFCWDLREARWMRFYERAAMLYERDGYFWWEPIPPTDSSFAHWLNAQRVERRAGTLKPERERLLEEIDFCWDTGEALWMRTYKRARELFEREGPMWSRTALADDPVMENWIYAQKSYHWEGTLDPERKALLDEIRIQWHAYDDTWELRLDQVRELVRSKGYARLAHEAEPALVEWVTVQQRNRRTLTRERRRKLEAAGVPLVGPREIRVELIWVERLAQLLRFKEAHGHADPTPKESNSLCRWVRRQRAHWDELAPQRKRALLAAGMVRDGPIAMPKSYPSLSWKQWLKGARQFKKRHGHLRLSDLRECDKILPGLYHFAYNVRSGEETITEEQRKILDQLGFDWGLPGTNAFFQARLRDLAAFKEEHGHCNVPQKSKTHRQLGQWVARLRMRREEISEARRKQLEEIGFVWDRMEELIATQWEAHFEDLLAYKEKHGDCLVSSNDPDWKSLYNWVSRTRRGRDALTAEQVQRLDRIGFVWNALRFEAAAAFEDRYAKLKAFQATHGHCRVSDANDPTGGVLKRWVVRQRDKRKRGAMSPEHEERLTKLGFHWKSRKSPTR